MSRSRSVALRKTFFISGLNSSTPFFFICKRTISPVSETSPTSKPATPSTVISSPFSKCCSVPFLKKSLRLPWLKLTSITRHTSSELAIGKFISQSCVFILLQLPVPQLPLLLQPFGVPVPQLPHPIYYYLQFTILFKK